MKKRSSLLLPLAILLVVMNSCASCKVAVNPQDTGDSPEEEETIEVEDERFPILAWRGVRTAQAKESFEAMKACGIEIYLESYGTLEEVQAVLDIAQEAGIKLFVRHTIEDMVAEVPKIKDHPALYGYYVQDEPEISQFAMLKDVVKQVQGIDRDHPCYINLYPNYYGAWREQGYAGILKQFLDLVSVPFLSFDFYPIVEENGVRSLRPLWYSNLEDVRSAAKEAGIPFWAFALTTCHTNYTTFYPVPKVGELRLQHFSNLVYGAQAFQYFNFLGIFNYSPTEVYARVKMVNEELQALAFIFKDADVKDVWHTGATIPDGTKKLDVMPKGIASLQSGDAGLIVSLVEKKGKTYVAIVNKDFQNPQGVEMSFTGAYKYFTRKGEEMPNTDPTAKLTLDPGDIAVFEIL